MTLIMVAGAVRPCSKAQGAESALLCLYFASAELVSLCALFMERSWVQSCAFNRKWLSAHSVGVW